MPHLCILKAGKLGPPIPLVKEQTVLGRDRNECDILVDSGRSAREVAVSRRHAIITRTEGRYYIEDGDGRGKPSVNHTYINDIQLLFKERVQLRHNDTIRICDNLFVFVHEWDSKHDSDRNRFPAEPGSSIDASISNFSSLFVAQPAQQLELLLEITNTLSNTLDLDTLLLRVTETLLKLFKQADRAFLLLVDETTGTLVQRGFQSRRPELFDDPGISLPIAQQCLVKVEGLMSNSPRPVICAPLRSGEKTAFGLLLVDIDSARRKFTENDLKLLAGIANQASIAVGNARFHREALEQERLNRDLKLARDVVRSFLPDRLPEIPGYEFYAAYESAQAVGGDYYDLVPLAGGRLGIVVGDVSGKGIAAAMVMARLSAMARACLQTEPDLATAISTLNTLLAPLNLTDRFVTLVAMSLDPVTHTLSVVNAGHPLPLLIRGATGRLDDAVPARTGGLPLGIASDLTYQSFDLVLSPGDRMVMFSDGVPDAVNVTNDHMGMTALQLLLEQGRAPPRQLGEKILQAVKEYSSGCSQHDDITIVCLGRDD